MLDASKYDLGLESKKDGKRYSISVSSNRVSASVNLPAEVKFDAEQTKALEFKLRMAMERILGKYFK